ncbi:glycosyl transferase [Ramlibacter sp. AW1]|uniref:Glycosyl transferase n=1 Tax=Ramlibacter aurantiacus TaxID=2801330 RepID=A0A937D7Q4_9BURK|nr:glycosyltransferase [Ramlibacter aurantiacus]MBL0422258.1 glycosyl transferase [Ramlibacter aurantiacus]
MLALLVLCGCASFVGCGLLVRLGRHTARRYRDDMPQRFHVGHVPRLGGVAMLVACFIGWVWMAVAEPYLGVVNGIRFRASEAAVWSAIVLLAGGGGVLEDLIHRLRARWRLLFTISAAVVAAVAFDLRVPSLGIPALDRYWMTSPLAGVLLAILATAGLPHAFNLIDGYNGLAGMVSLICCLALAYVALLVGDRALAAVVLALAGSTAGFLVWNYPRGLIFAGDGGAYLWGTVIAIASVVLTQRNPQVSPWFPMLLLAYPVMETVFSVYRKVVRGQSPSLADALHLHQLIYRRIVRGVFDEDSTRRMLMRNNRTSPYLWAFAVLTVVPAALFWQQTRVLIAFLMLFVLSYIYGYFSIVRFKVPRWLRR